MVSALTEMRYLSSVKDFYIIDIYDRNKMFAGSWSNRKK